MPNQGIGEGDRPRHQQFRTRYGPWVLVTGASDGIGKALATKIAARGVNVVLAARSGDRLQTIARDLAAAHGVETLVVATDLALPSGIDQLEQQTNHMDIGLVVLAAGFCISGPFADAPLASQLGMVGLNVTAVTHLVHTFAQRLVNRGHGGIMLFGSIFGRQGVPWVSTYAASKAYNETLAEGLHHELAPRGVDVLAVMPGPVRSGFAARADLKYGPETTPEVVAEAAIAALGKRATVVPGILSKFLSLTLLPRRARIRYFGYVVHRMRTPASSSAVDTDDSWKRKALSDGE